MFTFSAEQKAKLAAAFKKFDFRSPEQRFAMATKLVSFVVNDVYTQDIVGLIADNEDFNADEVLQFHTLKPIKAYILDPGSTGKRSRIIKDSVSLPENRVYAGVQFDLRQLRSGRFGTINDARRLVGEALLGQRNKQLWDTLNFALTSTDNVGNYATFATGATVATKKTALDTAIDYFYDNLNGGPGAIIGRYSALSWTYNIADTSTITEFFPASTKEEIMRRGWLGAYRGVPIFYLRNYKDADGTAMVDASNIHLVSPGTVKFGRLRPGLESFDSINGRNYSWGIDFWETYGSLIVESQRNYRLEIS